MQKCSQIIKVISKNNAMTKPLPCGLRTKLKRLELWTHIFKSISILIMKRDEPFNPSTNSTHTPLELIFRLATRKDCSAISRLMCDRNPALEASQLLTNTIRELDRLETDYSYKIYVADLNDEVIGFCRFYHTSGMSAQKKIYPSPEGWYGMGSMVSSKFRRQNIARFISSSRI